MAREDPIIDELHAIREAIAAASGDDTGRIADAFRARQDSGAREVVSFSQKRVVGKRAS